MIGDAWQGAINMFTMRAPTPPPLQIELTPQQLQPDLRSTRQKASDGYKAALKNLETREAALNDRIAADTHELHETKMVIASLEQALDMLHDPLDIENA